MTRHMVVSYRSIPSRGGCANNYAYVFGDPINTHDISGKACSRTVSKIAEYAGLYGVYTSAVDAIHGQGGWKDTRTQGAVNLITASYFHTKMITTEGQVKAPETPEFSQMVKWARTVGVMAAGGVLGGTILDAYCKFTAME